QLTQAFVQHSAKLRGLALDLLAREGSQPLLVFVNLVDDRLDLFQLAVEPRTDHLRYQRLEHQAPVRYRPWSWMYCATPGGTIVSMDTPRRTAARTPEADTSIGAISSTVAPAGRSLVSLPGRGITTTPASFATSSASRQRGNSRTASAPSIKNNLSSGCSVVISRRVSTVNDGPGRESSRPSRTNPGSPVIASRSMATRSSGPAWGPCLLRG